MRPGTARESKPAGGGRVAQPRRRGTPGALVLRGPASNVGLPLLGSGAASQGGCCHLVHYEYAFSS